MNDSAQRYHGISVSLHWLLSILIIGMLVLGKYMVSLEESEPLRFTLTQWHKSFGIVALMLIVLRLFWRFTHRPPQLPEDMQPWEVRIAGLTHILLYLLIILIPLSGWIMVSASPLDLPTVVFNSFHWPHITPVENLINKDEIASLFIEIHSVAGSVLILLLLAHIGAALRHQFILHDQVMVRMSPKTHVGNWARGVIPFTSAVVLILTGLIIYGISTSKSLPLVAGDSRVNFAFVLQKEPVKGIFTESKVELILDTDNPSANTLNAIVNTATATAGNSQIDSTLFGKDWFDIKNHPQASFQSTELVPDGDDILQVTGTLTIKEKSREIAFPINLTEAENKRMAHGFITVNRLDFELGKSSQPTEKTVGFDVVVGFEFEITKENSDTNI